MSADRLVDIERQVGAPNLSETALQSQTLHAERRIDPVTITQWSQGGESD